MKVNHLCCLLSVCWMISCSNKTQNTDEVTLGKVEMKYAKGFSIERNNNYSLITLNNPWKGENTEVQYLLYRNEKPKVYEDATKIKIPIRSVACMSLTHMAFIEKLGLEKSIVAASGCDYSNSNKIKNRVEAGKIKEIGVVQSINYEMLVNESPEVVMCYGIDQNSISYLNKLKKLRLTTVLNSEYMETHPLGKVEWIKFVAEFYGLEDKADSIFNSIEEEYLALTDITDTIKNKSTVFVGMPWNGNWYVAGGKSFQAKLFEDCGADYLWKDNLDYSSIVKSKELIYEKAYNADFWLNQNSYSNINEVIEFDERLSNFKAIKEKNLYNNNNRVNEFQGNDYWESGTVNPHIVLKDLIEIFHPDILDHQLYYYKKLE